MVRLWRLLTRRRNVTQQRDVVKRQRAGPAPTPRDTDEQLLAMAGALAAFAEYLRRICSGND